MPRATILPPSLARLVNELSKLPTVGPKTAHRLAFHILNTHREEVGKLAQALLEVKDKIHFCRLCGGFTEQEFCAVCQDETREKSRICVVEHSSDIIAIERAGNFKGLYHVLGGAISPLEGISPGDLRIKELLARLDTPCQEIILATNLSVEGEATALYLTRLIKPLRIKITRIAHGLPVGGNLEYADEVTLAKAMEGRRLISDFGMRNADYTQHGHK
ncbi:MAG: recombination mediator RecR [bacterium]|nr:recombination mediator RecR [bacterium]